MSVTARSRFLDPAALAAVRDLRLVAKTVVHGFLAGQHLDPRPGAGVEFSQYRVFEPGDDARRVDWRLYGRSDRLYLRQAEVERDVTVRFLLDASGSMAHRDSAAGGLVKLDYARSLVAALAYLADLQGDRLALHAVIGGGVVDAAPHGRRGALIALLSTLEELAPAGPWPSWEHLAPRLHRPRGRELVVVVSDLWDQPARAPEDSPATPASGELRTALARLAAGGHEVLVLQLLARDELDFTYAGDLLFEDLESGETVRAHAGELRPLYRERLAAWLDAWRRELTERRVTHELIATDQPLDHALRALLLRRRALP